MGFESGYAFYTSDLQRVYAPLVLPGLFGIYWFASGQWRTREGDSASRRFVRLYVGLFCIETLVDPIATGPGIAWLGLGDAGATAVGLLFVLLGDFRVFWLVFALSGPGRSLSASAAEAAKWTPIVALSAFAIHAAIGAAIGQQPGQALWLIHELLFVAMAIWLRERVIPTRTAAAEPNRPKLRASVGFVIAYYGLWATCDAIIWFGGFDWGWLLRTLPNQLYYAVWIPAVYYIFIRRE